MPFEIPPRCSACGARDISLCADLPADDLAALNAIGRHRALAPGQVLGWAGAPAPMTANVVAGVLKVARQDGDGRTQIVGLLFPGDFAGDPFMPHATDTITALTQAILCIYPQGALSGLLAARPSTARLLLRRTLATLTATRRALPMLMYARAEARLAAFLLDMAARIGVDDDRMFRLPLSRGAIADLLGLAIETVSRQMTAFCDAAYIALPGLRSVRLLDRVALGRLAD